MTGRCPGSTFWTGRGESPIRVLGREPLHFLGRQPRVNSYWLCGAVSIRGCRCAAPCEAMATVRLLQFGQGVPQFSGEPELFDEYLDRVETWVIGWTDEVVKKSGPLGPRLYNAERRGLYGGEGRQHCEGGLGEERGRRDDDCGAEELHQRSWTYESWRDLRQIL